MKNLKILLLLLFTAAFFAGCGEDDIQTPDEAVSEYITAFKELDFEKLSGYTISGENPLEILIVNGNEDNTFLLEKMTEELEYKILNTNIINQAATVELSMTNIDMRAVMNDIVGEVFSYAMENSDSAYDDTFVSEMIHSRFENEELTTVTNEVVLGLVFDDESQSWKLNDDALFYDGLSGGYTSFVNEMSQAFGEYVDETSEQQSDATE